MCSWDSVCVCVFVLETEALSGQPAGEPENLHLLLFPRRQQKESISEKAEGCHGEQWGTVTNTSGTKVRWSQEKLRNITKEAKEERWARLLLSFALPLSRVLSQQHDQGLTLLWWQLLAAVEKTDQFGLSFRRSPAMLPMTPRNIQLLGSTEGGWRAPKETNCSFPKWELEPSE